MNQDDESFDMLISNQDYNLIKRQLQEQVLANQELMNANQYLQNCNDDLIDKNTFLEVNSTKQSQKIKNISMQCLRLSKNILTHHEIVNSFEKKQILNERQFLQKYKNIVTTNEELLAKVKFFEAEQERSNAEKEKLKAIICDLQGKLNKEKDNESERNSIISLKDLNNSLSKDNIFLQQKVSNFQEEVSRMHKEANILNQKLTNSQKKILLFQGEAILSEEKVWKLEQNSRILQEEMRLLESKATSLQDKVHDLEEQLLIKESSLTEMSFLKDKGDYLEQQITTKKQRILELQNTLITQHQTLSSIKKQYSSCKNQLRLQKCIPQPIKPSTNEYATQITTSYFTQLEPEKINTFSQSELTNIQYFHKMEGNKKQAENCMKNKMKESEDLHFQELKKSIDYKIQTYIQSLTLKNSIKQSTKDFACEILVVELNYFLDDLKKNALENLEIAKLQFNS